MIAVTVSTSYNDLQLGLDNWKILTILCCTHTNHSCTACNKERKGQASKEVKGPLCLVDVATTTAIAPTAAT